MFLILKDTRLNTSYSQWKSCVVCLGRFLSLFLSSILGLLSSHIFETLVQATDQKRRFVQEQFQCCVEIAVRLCVRVRACVCDVCKCVHTYVCSPGVLGKMPGIFLSYTPHIPCGRVSHQMIFLAASSSQLPVSTSSKLSLKWFQYWGYSCAWSYCCPIYLILFLWIFMCVREPEEFRRRHWVSQSWNYRQV